MIKGSLWETMGLLWDDDDDDDDDDESPNPVGFPQRIKTVPMTSLKNR